MNEDELNFIKTTMKYRLNKEIKELKKLYKATIDGDSAKMFHSKCDGIRNTLVIIKSVGNRRLVVLQQKNGVHVQKVFVEIMSLIKMHFYFLLIIKKKFFLIREEKIIIIMKIE